MRRNSIHLLGAVFCNPYVTVFASPDLIRVRIA